MKQRLLIASALSASIATMTMLALVFFCLAGYFYLAPIYGQISSALIIGVSALFVSAILGGIAAIALNSAKEHLKQKLRLSALTSLAPAAFSTISRRFGGVGALAAMAVGYWATSRKSR